MNVPEFYVVRTLPFVLFLESYELYLKNSGPGAVLFDNTEGV